MATTTNDLRAYRRSLDGLVGEATRQVEAVLAAQDVANPVAVARLMDDVSEAVIGGYGDMSAALAADYYDDMRAASVTRTDGYRAPLAAPLPTDQIVSSSRWAVGPLFAEGGPNVAMAVRNYRGIIDRLVQRPARLTLIEGGKADPARPRFARVPTYAPGHEVCKFCVMLASRGAVYLSAASAGEHDDFHNRCKCDVIPVWPGDSLPSHYDPAFYLDAYKAGRSVVVPDPELLSAAA